MACNARLLRTLIAEVAEVRLAQPAAIEREEIFLRTRWSFEAFFGEMFRFSCLEVCWCDRPAPARPWSIGDGGWRCLWSRFLESFPPSASQSSNPVHLSLYILLGLRGILSGRSSDRAQLRHAARSFSLRDCTWARASTKGRYWKPRPDLRFKLFFPASAFKLFITRFAGHA